MIKELAKRFIPPTTKMVDARFEQAKASIQDLALSADSISGRIGCLERAGRTRVLCSIADKERGSLSTLDECVISVASYGKRIETVSDMLLSLAFQQSYKCKIVLALPVGDFPHRWLDLPIDLLEVLDCLEIEVIWVEDDLKSHNKYYWAMLRYPDSYILTLDDDCYYPADEFRRLWESHLRYPDAIVSLRSHRMRFASQSAKLLPYGEWEYEQQTILDLPSSLLFPTGVGGVLYPPRTLPSQAFSIELIRRLCLGADDVWLKMMSAVNRVKVVTPSGGFIVDNIEGSQTVGLCYENTGVDGLNDAYIAAVTKLLSEAKWGENTVEWIQSDRR